MVDFQYTIGTTSGKKLGTSSYCPTEMNSPKTLNELEAGSSSGELPDEDTIKLTLPGKLVRP
jgi:hypothetical protein